MTTDNTIARLYRDACCEDARLLAGINPGDLIDLAQGRLAGERRARLIDAIAGSPSLASAYRLARATRDWSQALAADMTGEASVGSNVRALPTRHARPAVALQRRPFAMAAAVGAMAIGALFVTQRLQTPGEIEAGFAGSATTAEDEILAVSFGSKSDNDVIFSARSQAESDRIFAFGKGS